MGTFVTITLEAPEADALCTEAFREGERLAEIFSPFGEGAMARVARLAIGDALEIPPELAELWRRALVHADLSRGAFNAGALDAFELAANRITRRHAGEVDLRGLAKGFIVDRMLARIQARAPQARGSVNAGGDLRLLHKDPEASVDLRLGSRERPVTRTVRLTQPAVATSSLAVAEEDPRSSTRYRGTLRAPLTAQHAVTVMAPTAETADALCKVGLFAEPEVIAACARHWQATVLVFDAQGGPIEAYQGS